MNGFVPARKTSKVKSVIIVKKQFIIIFLTMLANLGELVRRKLDGDNYEKL
ncbi:TPA: hypothetical protein U0924_001913 [Streptococcus suis 89-2479]|nr:hypothetical protein [Streptococcus suis]HEM3187175.1 hypothetical protein [Streptococcus suis 89-2479]HEM3708770.1 hypothetical protein [Streptococcus suis]